MSAIIDPDDVRNGKAIPQPGDVVGNHRYLGGGITDPSRYQPLDPAKSTGPSTWGT